MFHFKLYLRLKPTVGASNLKGLFTIVGFTERLSLASNCNKCALTLASLPGVGSMTLNERFMAINL